jgi:hypothetical protein
MRCGWNRQGTINNNNHFVPVVTTGAQDLGGVAQPGGPAAPAAGPSARGAHPTRGGGAPQT